MLFVEISVALVLVLWFLLSVVRQFPGQLAERIEMYDILHLIPIWTFFAPRPGSSDYHLLYRDFDADGETSGWIQIPTAYQRSIVRAIWNPNKRLAKGVHDMTQMVLQMQSAFSDRPAALRLSIPYLALTNFVSTQPRSDGVVSREFVIVETHGHHPRYPLQVVFRSDAHRIR